jgi:DNA-binding CsgD family transcriptional regulator
MLDDIYDAVGDDEAYRRLPGLIAKDIDSRSCVLQVFSKEGELTEFGYNHFTDELFSHYAENKFYEIDHWLNFVKARQTFSIVTNFDQLIPIQEFHQTDFYNDLFRFFGDDTARCLGGMFPMGEEMFLFGLHRAGKDKAFDEDQVANMQALAPHLVRMLRARALLDRERHNAQHIKNGLDSIRLGVISVEETGRLVHANESGWAILDAQDGLRLERQTVVAQSASRARLAEAIKSAALRTGRQGGGLLVERPSGAQAYRVTIIPEKSGASGYASLIIDDPADKDPGFEHRVASLYSLSKAEAEIATLLAEGLSPTEVAERRRVSLETVRTQLKHILDKTEAPRLGSLLALLARTVRTR